MRRFLCGLVAALLACSFAPALAGTTGSLRGSVYDTATKAPLAGVRVTAVAPSQSETTTTDSAGEFHFISLVPDTYVVRAEKTGYEPASQPGVVIFADQPLTLALGLEPALRTIARVGTRGGTQVRPGTTSDVYSVNSSGIKTTQAVGGAGSMNQVYSAISAVPGVNVPTNQQGWNQGVYVRGGDYQQVAYEFDGLPLTRQSDLNPIATLSSLGTQEVQVYTGGTAASSNSSGLAGYINQVIKTGTSPGYADATLGVGSPAFYHSATVEVSGATPDRLFSYYLGLSGSNQDYRYADQFNGASNPLYFYPLAIPTTNSQYEILDGNCAIVKPATCSAPNYGAYFSPGNSYAQAFNQDRENVANFHFAIPHRNDGLRDDIQLLWVGGGINTWFYSSANELGPANVTAAFGAYPVSWFDSTNYTGPMMQKPNPKDLVLTPFPNSVAHTVGSDVPANQRDGSFNGYGIEKFQYQKNFNSSSYLRFQAYGEYTNWFITAPTSADLTFGAELADYEVWGHVYGGVLNYTNQLSARHLVTLQTTYEQQKLQTYNATFSSTDPTASSLGATGLGTVLSNYVGKNGNCYNYQTGQLWSCFDAGSQGGCIQPPYAGGGCYPSASGFGLNLTPKQGYGCGGRNKPAACGENPQWIMTENGQSSQVDDVMPLFSSYSATDLWQPNDKLTINAGVRLDHFAYATSNLADATTWPARQFWFTQFNKEHCGAIGYPTYWTWNGSSFGPCLAGLRPMTDPGNGLYNVGAGLSVHNVFQPRASFTWLLSPGTVLRGSAGVYARAEASSYYQYNTAQQNLASFIRQFYPLGYHTPDHELYPDTSNNYDMSIEHALRGTNISFKLSPFYRSTSNQVQFQSIDALGGTLAGLNVGTQKSTGVELAIQSGDFARDGLSYLFSYTYTDNSITFHPINGVSVIDSLNNPIEQFNSFTIGCANVTPSSANWAACGSGRYAGNAAPYFNNPCNPSGSSSCTVRVANPYYCPKRTGACPYEMQPLFNVNGSYAPYDVIPSPFNAANGFEVPNVLSFVTNFRHDKYAITPSIHYLSGSSYGSPLVWPGYVPQSCTQKPSRTPLTPGASCPGTTLNGYSTGAIFLPDPYNGYKYDNLGQYSQPSQLTLNISASYDFSSRISATLTAVNIYNQCFQRGYAWDNSQTCVYSTLPSNILGAAGNFLARPPVQVKYPYGTFFNITEVGNSSMAQPINLFLNVTMKI